MAEALPVQTRPPEQRRKFVRAIWMTLLAALLVWFLPLAQRWLIWYFDVKPVLPWNIPLGETRQVHPWSPWDSTIYTVLSNIAHLLLFWCGLRMLRQGQDLYLALPTGLYASILVVIAFGAVDFLVWVIHWPQPWGLAAHFQVVWRSALLCAVLVMGDRFAAYTVAVCRRGQLGMLRQALRLARGAAWCLFAFLLLDRAALLRDMLSRPPNRPPLVLPLGHDDFVIIDRFGAGTRMTHIPPELMPHLHATSKFISMPTLPSVAGINRFIGHWRLRPISVGIANSLAALAAVTWVVVAITLGRGRFEPVTMVSESGSGQKEVCIERCRDR